MELHVLIHRPLNFVLIGAMQFSLHKINILIKFDDNLSRGTRQRPGGNGGKLLP